MQIIARCPKCFHKWLLEIDAADRRITCRKCNNLFKVPRLQEISKAIKVMEGATGTIYADQDGKIYG
ncbi:MAG: hypothetical protein KAS69_02750 [Planctomycetes bacterium]|nr:hypothetical protein [Planctomycetota bacterium]